MLKERIRELASGLLEEVTINRRHLHAHPELSYREYQTAAFVEEKLRALGIPFNSMADTGRVAL